MYIHLLKKSCNIQLNIRLEKINEAEFLIGWKDQEKIKVKCKNSINDFMKLYESYKNSYMPLAEDSFQNNLTHKWIRGYSKYISESILKKSEISETQITNTSSPITLTQSFESEIREDYLAKELRKHKLEYSIEEILTIYIVSYNAGGKKPKRDIEMPVEFFMGKTLENEKLADLYVVCIQEVCPLNPKNVLTKSDNPKVWEDYLSKSLNTFSEKHGGVKYIKIAADCMVGLFIIVFLRKDKISLCNHIITSTVAVGVFGIVVYFSYSRRETKEQ